MSAIDRGCILLRSIKLKRLNRSDLSLLGLGEIHDYNVRMELRRGIAGFVIWPRRRMFELGGDHLAGSNCRFIPTASGLYVSLEYFQRFLHALPVRHSHAFVIANECGERNRFGRAEGRIPTGSVFTGS